MINMWTCERRREGGRERESGCEDMNTSRWEKEDMKMRRCEMWRWQDDMRRCEDVKMACTCEDVNMICLNVKMWRCDAWIQNCIFTSTHTFTHTHTLLPTDGSTHIQTEGYAGPLEIAIIPQHLLIQPHFSHCAGNLKTIVLLPLFGRSNLIVCEEGCRGAGSGAFFSSVFADRKSFCPTGLPRSKFKRNFRVSSCWSNLISCERVAAIVQVWRREDMKMRRWYVRMWRW